MNDTYYIIFPRGDRSKLTVVGLAPAMTYEISDYARASRKEFSDRDEAIEYGKTLAFKHELTWEPADTDDGYLD